MGNFLADRNRAFWTMSMWKDLNAMRAFRGSKVHASTMPNAARWCDEASVVHWETEAAELPAWDEAHRRMSEEGKPSPLRFQSEDYKARRYQKPAMNHLRCLVVLPRK